MTVGTLSAYVMGSVDKISMQLFRKENRMLNHSNEVLRTE